MPTVVHIENGAKGKQATIRYAGGGGAIHRMSTGNPHLLDMNEKAREGTKHEHGMTLWQAIKLYPKAVAWSAMLSTALIMEGYDIVLLGSFFAFPTFRQKFGEKQADGTYQLSAAWQSGLSNGAVAGEIIGLFINGIMSERFGYRRAMIWSLAATIPLIAILFFAKNTATLQVGEVLLGIPWGVFQTLTTAYASEVCPVALRAYLTTYVNLCWIFGQMIAAGILRIMLSRKDEWSWRIPYALQWIWPVPIIVGVIFAPESPWWLVRQGRVADAKKALLRLTSKSDPTFDVDQTVAMIVHTNDLEMEISVGTSYLDCFKGVDLRRTEIACLAWAIQNLCGSAFMGYSTYFYEQAGFPTDKAFDLSLAQYGIGFIGSIGSWFLMSYFGRRSLYLWGLFIMTILLFIIGFIALAPDSSTGATWAVGSMLLVYTFVYDITIGPVCYSIIAEISSVRLRTKTIVLARNLYNMCGIMNNVITPFMLNPSAWNWRGKTGFFWGSICTLCFIWTYFRLPEPKGRTFGELDILFERKITARKFDTTVVDPFASTDIFKRTDSLDSDKLTFAPDD
ncbi:MAG: hypothetical protein M1829_000091 [Trizodia sp. TS-e1964]|nr:MAG: hypothetical protein M1829_000091 [Trizodia sp. TS-e1964]